ncbi:hypothetical protein ACJX0J_028076, partial [Zea mays]
GHEGRYSIYVHASREKPVHTSSLFAGRDIHSDAIVWGLISMVDAEKRLLANALEDVDNQVFVLLSDSCVPLHSFDYVYNYLMGTNVSFIDCFKDPGPHGSGRYPIEMYPEIDESDFRKGAQWFAVTRRHALMILADSLYYKKFKLYCKPAEGRNCIADEHYLPTLFNMVDPGGISNWSVTHVDWSEGKWHPRSYSADDVTYDLLKNITLKDISCLQVIHLPYLLGSGPKDIGTTATAVMAWSTTQRLQQIRPRTAFVSTYLLLLVNHSSSVMRSSLVHFFYCIAGRGGSTLSPQPEAQAPHDPQTPEQQQSGTGVGIEQMGMIHGPGIESTRFNNYLHGSKCLIRTEDEMNRKGKLTCERGGGSHNQRAWFNTSIMFLVLMGLGTHGQILGTLTFT